MIPSERQFRIVEIVNQQGAVEVPELAQSLGVSEITIRRDLDKLSEEGLVIRSHGGALSVRQVSTAFDPPYEMKRRVRMEEKRLIGAAAASFVQDDETLILDSGSTTFQMVPHLGAYKNLTVVTNDLIIATELSRTTSHRVVILGGLVRQGIFSTWGHYVESMLSELAVNRAFMAADAVQAKQGIMNATLDEVPHKRLMLSAARHRYLLVDHSKFFKTALAKVCDLTEVNHVITDDGLPEQMRAEIHEAGIELTVVSESSDPKRQYEYESKDREEVS